MSDKKFALKALAEGKKVRRSGWLEKAYIVLKEDGSIRDEQQKFTDLNSCCNSDWEIYEDSEFEKLKRAVKTIATHFGIHIE